MTPFSFKSEFQYYQQQIFSATDDREDFVAMPQSQYKAQSFLEGCDTPPTSNRHVSYNSSNLAIRSGGNTAGRGNTFDSRDVLRPSHNGISPRYNHNSTDHKAEGRGTNHLQTIEALQQRSDDPFTSNGLSVGSSTSSLTSNTTIRNFSERAPSVDDEVEMIHDARYSNNTPLHTRPQRFQDPNYDFLKSKQVLVTDAGPDNYLTSYFMNQGEHLVFTHAKRPSQSKSAKFRSPKKYRTLASQATDSIENGSPRKTKRKIRAEDEGATDDEAIGNIIGRERARKFREDSSRWWKIVVNPTGRWDADKIVPLKSD